jgi:hypothetical protein
VIVMAAFTGGAGLPPVGAVAAVLLASPADKKIGSMNDTVSWGATPHPAGWRQSCPQ